MNQADFDAATKSAGAVYIPFSGQGDHYELVGIAVVSGSVNNRIRVIPLDENGHPAFGAWVRHSFGTDFEHFQFVGDPVQFNLGSGSHYSIPNDPPDHIVIEGSSDEVRVGNSNLIGFSHTEWQLTYMLKKASINPPPPSGEFLTVANFDAFRKRLADAVLS